MTAGLFDHDDVRRALRAGWQRQTSSDPTGWTPANPALGQCAVTALIVQDFFGGALLRTVVQGVSHYWNELPSGDELDLTRHQFERYEPEGREHRPRDYVLSYPDTELRYMRLLEHVVDHLENTRAERPVAAPVQFQHS